MFGFLKRNSTPPRHVTGKVVRFGSYQEGDCGSYSILVEGETRPVRFRYPQAGGPTRQQYVELTQPGDEVSFILLPNGILIEFENKNLEWFDSKTFY